MTANDSARVPELIQVQFDDLMKSLDSIASRIDRSETGNQWLSRVLLKLIYKFQANAGVYFSLATDVISSAKVQNSQIRELYEYGRVLNKILDHVSLLDEMSQYALSAPQPLLEAFIWGAAGELSEMPILVPLRRSQYSYVHFNYVRSVGVIGYAIPTLTRLPQDVAILWHEVAGYLVDRVRRDGRLKAWAVELQKRLKYEEWKSESFPTAWDWYWRLFMTSKLERWAVKLNISKTEDGSTLVVDDSADIRRYFNYRTGGDDKSTGEEVETVDTDLAWQIDWLGEFVEDLYGVRSLGAVYFHTLASVLLQRYRVLTIGDLKHPAPLLRLQVAYGYLMRLGTDESYDDLRSALAPKGLDAALPATDEVKPEWWSYVKAAGDIIVGVLVGVFETDDNLFARDRVPVGSNDQWKAMVSYIHKASKANDYHSLRPPLDDALFDLVSQVCSKYSTAIDDGVINNALDQATGFWTTPGYKPSNDANDNLRWLHAIEFTGTDGNLPIVSGQNTPLKAPQ
jgi:hypothetical protein